MNPSRRKQAEGRARAEARRQRRAILADAIAQGDAWDRARAKAGLQFGSMDPRFWTVAQVVDAPAE